MESDTTFDEQVSLVEQRLAREPQYRLALYRLLGFCEQQRTLEEIEAEVAGYPEMAASPYSARTVLGWLVEPDAVTCLNADEAEGAPAQEDGEGGHPYLFEISPVGAQVLENRRSSRPLDKLVDEYPCYAEAFERVLAACAKPLSRQEIEALFKGDPILEEPKKVYPNFFLDKLEAAGGIVFDGGWLTTGEGAAFLAAK